MAAQLDYGYALKRGLAGAKVDLTRDIVLSRRNEAADGALLFGLAVAVGTAAGTTVKLPSAKTDVIEGVALYAGNTEEDRDGKAIVKKDVELDVMKKGHVWGRLAVKTAATESTAAVYVTPAYGATAYVVCSGDNAGRFTPTSDDTTKDIGATFGNATEDGIAVIYLN